MIKKIFWLLWFIMASTNGISAQENILKFSLTSLLDSSLEKNYLLQANEKTTLIKQAEIEILKTNYQPVISASASVSYWKFLLPNKQRLLGDALSDVYTDISFYQRIYDWGGNKAEQALVDEEILLNDELKRQIQNTIIWGVSDTYFETLRAKSEVTIHLNSLNQLYSHLQYAENLFSIGKVSNLDILKINVQISVEEKNLQKAKNAVLARMIKLKRLCNLDEKLMFEIENNTDIWFQEKQNQIFIHEDIYTEVFHNHPALNIAARKMDMESKQKQIYSLRNRPELFSYGIASWEDGYIPFGSNFNYNIGVGLRYTLPYWGGSSFRTRMLQSDYRIEQIDWEKNQTFLDIKKEIDLALSEISDIKSEMTNVKKIIDLAKETHDNALVKYQSGQGAIIDVLDAQAILTDAEINYRNSLTVFLQLLAKLNYLTGSTLYPF